MSGMLGQLLGGLMGAGQQPAQQSPMFAILQQVLASGGGSGSAGGGGLATLISRFQAAGLGQQAQSWVGTGQNLPVAPDQLDQVFTPTQIDSWGTAGGNLARRHATGVVAGVAACSRSHDPGWSGPAAIRRSLWSLDARAEWRDDPANLAGAVLAAISRLP